MGLEGKFVLREIKKVKGKVSGRLSVTVQVIDTLPPPFPPSHTHTSFLPFFFLSSFPSLPLDVYPALFTFYLRPKVTIHFRRVAPVPSCPRFLAVRSKEKKRHGTSFPPLLSPLSSVSPVPHFLYASCL